MWTWILARLSEPSTYRGIIAIAASAGIVVQPNLATQIASAGIALAGLIEIIRKEK
jgi:hypothetical protein